MGQDEQSPHRCNANFTVFRMIYFTTKAYNAGKTLRRAVESVLAQTCGDFTYHLCDNGSTDGTGEIVREYAKLDKRVIPFFNQRNHEWTSETERYVYYLMKYLNDEDWFCVLDADDDYDASFLKEMLDFAYSNCLDYVACRSNFIDETTGVSLNEYVLGNDIIIEGEGAGTLFPEYFRFMGAHWGKLQKGKMLNSVDWAELANYAARLQLSHRGDTLAQLWRLRHSRRAGVLARLLHNYRHYRVSYSTQNLESKIRDNHKMPDVYRDFLMAKVGYVSPENEKFINEVFARSMRRTYVERDRYGQ
jgi:glycosyltransferase involved in cell wall biosynthesis